MNYSGLHNFRRGNDDTSIEQEKRNAAARDVYVSANPQGSFEDQVERLVCGTLTSQAYTKNLEEVHQRCEAFDARLVNLTRLLKLSQNIQEEKDTDLRRECEELRARLKQEEHQSSHLQRELDALREMVPTLVQEEVRQQLGRQAFCTTAQLDSAVADLRREAEALGEQLSGLKGTMDTHATTRDGMEARLAAIDAQLRETAGALADRTGAEGLAATQQWTKKNLQRLKERTEHLSSQMEEVLKTQKRLDSDITVVDAKTDGVNKKLRRMLQQKATEADALKALLEKELNHVREVADEHEVLRNTGATYGELKF